MKASRTLMEGLGNPSTTLVFEQPGIVDANVVQQLLDKAEKHSHNRCDPVPVRKKLFTILVEGLENIYRHAGDSAYLSVATLIETNEGYIMLLGNTVPVMLGAMMENRIGMLNEMEEDELKEYYLKLLSNDGRTERGGAGIGLFTMARKCDRPMQLHIVPLDPHNSCMLLQVRVGRR